MPYSERDLEEIGRDPVRLRAWVWHMVQHHKRLARKQRAQAYRVSQFCTVGFGEDDVEEGRDLLKWADISERMAKFMEENIDRWVRFSLDPAICSCRDLR